MGWEKMNKNKQLFINMAASFVSLGVSIGISFFLSPYIVENVGTEAYGFVALSNNFVMYFSLISIALNSMSSRFIAVAYFRNDISEADRYFSATFFSNVVLSVALFPILFYITLRIDRLVNIDETLVLDVKFLAGFMSVNFLVGLLSTNLGIVYYIKNKLYISSLLNIAGWILKALLLFLLFSKFGAHVACVGGVALVITLYEQAFNLYYKNKFLPNLKIRKSNFRFSTVKELLFSGIWNTVTRLGSMLQDGLDLLVANLMIGPNEMGTLALARIFPDLINSVLGRLAALFMPNLTDLYANGRKDEFVYEIKKAMKIIGLILNIPIAFLIAFGDVLFSLWLPTQNARLLQLLSFLAVLPWAVMGQAAVIHNIFTIINKIKLNSLLVCLTGALSVSVVFVLLKTTDLGLFAVAGVSSVFSILRNLCYTVPFGALYINRKWHTFFPEVVKSALSVFVIGGAGMCLKSLIPALSWFGLCMFAFITVLGGLVINFFIVFNEKDRTYLISALRARLKGA
jgi:O-antigen/teichoic acid export membrane protein